MYKTRLAIFKHQCQEIIVVPLDCSFEERPAWQRKKALDDLRKSTVKAGLVAPVAAVWRVGSKLRFVAPNEWHPFLGTLTWNTIISNLSFAIDCHEDSSRFRLEQVAPAQETQASSSPTTGPRA